MRIYKGAITVTFLGLGLATASFGQTRIIYSQNFDSYPTGTIYGPTAGGIDGTVANVNMPDGWSVFGGDANTVFTTAVDGTGPSGSNALDFEVDGTNSGYPNGPYYWYAGLGRYQLGFGGVATYINNLQISLDLGLGNGQLNSTPVDIYVEQFDQTQQETIWAADYYPTLTAGQNHISFTANQATPEELPDGTLGQFTPSLTFDVVFEFNTGGFDLTTPTYLSVDNFALTSLAPPLLGDANFDNKVDSADLAALINGQQMNLTGWSNGDFNGNGIVDQDDYSLFFLGLAEFNNSGRAVPEPISAAIMAFGSLGMFIRRRRRI